MEKLVLLSDSELIERFVDGDELSAKVLIDRHKNRIYAYILMLVKQQDIAEDIFQDTFIKILTSLKRGKYIENGRFVSWAMRISHNLVIDLFRKGKNLQEVSNDSADYDLLNSSKFSDDNIEEKIIYTQILKEVGELVKFLPENQQEVIKLRHYMGLSFKEIAEETGVSINTALGRMRYAIINLRALIEEKKISLTI